MISSLWLHERKELECSLKTVSFFVVSVPSASVNKYGKEIAIFTHRAANRRNGAEKIISVFIKKDASCQVGAGSHSPFARRNAMRVMKAAVKKMEALVE